MTIAEYHECKTCGKGGALNCVETDLKDRYDCPYLDFYCDKHLPKIAEREK